MMRAKCALMEAFIYVAMVVGTWGAGRGCAADGAVPDQLWGLWDERSDTACAREINIPCWIWSARIFSCCVMSKDMANWQSGNIMEMGQLKLSCGW